MKILLTNDDSHQSPLLAIIIENLKKYAELTIVVPKHEQSWKGKSMTRFGYLHLEEMTLYGEKAYTVDGTPADCVNIGIHHLFEGSKPDLIVSGINAGLNAGLGFMLSSGTLGACFEGNIAGVPGIAFSQHFDSYTRESYIPTYAIAEETYNKFRTQSALIFDKLLPLFFQTKRKELLGEPITWNINFPFHLKPEVPLAPCSTGQSFYGSCYSKSIVSEGDKAKISGVRFEHELKDITTDQADVSDGKLLFAGNVTVNPIDLRTFAQLDSARQNDLSSIFK